MADASDQLGQGALQLKDAAASFGQGVDDAARSLDVLASHRDERASVASARVTVDMGAARVEPATAVAPLAVACALWIGSAVASCVLPDIDRRAALAGRAVRAVLNQIAVYAAFAILQTAAGGVALGACGCFEGLGLSQVFVVLATLLLASCACCAFAQALRLLAPRAALGVELVLFALQLMAAGVVVPASMASPGAAVFGALTPMGAVAAAVRSALAGHFAVSSVGLLAGVVAVSLGVVFLFARCARRVRPERLRTAA